MRYKDYHGYTKTFILVHNTGTGVMEDPYIEHEVVYETDDYADAVATSELLKMENNSHDSIISGWCNNTYHININTLTDKGKEELEKFHNEADRIHQHVKDNPTMYTTHRVNGITFNMMKVPEFETNNFLDLTKGKIIGGYDTNTGEFNIETES